MYICLNYLKLYEKAMIRNQHGGGGGGGGGRGREALFVLFLFCFLDRLLYWLQGFLRQSYLNHYSF